MTPDQFARARRSMSEQMVRSLLTLFLGLGSWRDADVTRFVAQAVPLVGGTQRALAALVAAFTASQAGAALRKPVAPSGISDAEAVDLRAGIGAAEVYARPFATVYHALSQGKSLKQALRLGEVRLSEIAEMDLQQTYARASRAAMRALPAGAQAKFWRRELSGLENCGLCVLASTQRYTVEDLNPIHGNCDCLVKPIFGRDPGQVIAPELLEQVHTAVEQLTGTSDRGGRAPDYRDLLVQMTPEHGELGPLLVRPRDRFTAQADLAS